jgi:glycosyltransferase involved in cell wall biosynthesis
LKIAYVTPEDPQDVHAWSGLVYHIGHALEPYAQVEYTGPLPYKRFLSDKLRQVVCESVSGKRHKRGREPWLLKHQAEQARPRVTAADPDIVFACGSLPIAYLECRPPVVIWIDSTFAGLLDYHPEYFNLCPHAIAMGNAAEKRALDLCTRVIFASEWAARIAQEHYRLPPQKVAVVPFGSNLDIPLSVAEVHADIRRRSKSVCRLLLVGVDWHWKGADLALEVANQLRAAAIPAELTIVGCQPPVGAAVPDWVRVTGFISQRTEEGRARMAELYREAHFFLFPTRADCFGVVVAEANSYGVPVIASTTGGIPVESGVNGTKVGRFVPDSVAYITTFWANPARYLALAESSRNEYDTRLNWRVSGRKVAEILAAELAAVPDTQEHLQRLRTGE